MKTNYLLSALLMIAAVGCTKEMVENQGAVNAPAFGTQTFTATVEAPVADAATKSFDGTIKAFRFVEGNEIAISDGTTTSVFAATEIGENDVTFTIKAGQTELASSGVTYKAYYPASIAPGMSGVAGEAGMYMMQQQITSNGPIPDGKNVNYTESLYEANPMYAESTNSELNFTNLCGLICVTLSQPSGSNYAISQVILQSASQPLFGQFDIVDGCMSMTSSDPCMRRIAVKNTNAKYVAYNDKYYIAVPAGTYDDVEFIPQTNGRLKQHFPIKAGRTMTIERNKIYTVTLNMDDLRNDLSDGDPVLGVAKLGTYGPGNCYLIHAGTDAKFMFKPTRGSDPTPIDGIASVEVLWRSQATKTMTVDQVVKDSGLEYKDGYIRFTTSNNRGNALIGARDANGDLLWSWHIWLVTASTDPSIEVYPNGSAVLDRNLGALETTFAAGANTNLCSGLYYQYGRKDPFPARTTNTTSVTPWTGTETFVRNTSTTPTTIAESILHPGTFYATNGNWTTDAAATWDTAEKSIYDPCPAGYRVWNNTCWETYAMANVTAVKGVTISKEDTETETNAGYTIALPSSTAYYAVNGSVKAADGKLSAPCSMYRAWARNVVGGKAAFYHIQNGTNLAVSSFQVTSVDKTAYGMGVRCEKIQ